MFISLVVFAGKPRGSHHNIIAIASKLHIVTTLYLEWSLVGELENAAYRLNHFCRDGKASFAIAVTSQGARNSN